MFHTINLPANVNNLGYPDADKRQKYEITVGDDLSINLTGLDTSYNSLNWSLAIVIFGNTDKYVSVSGTLSVTGVQTSYIITVPKIAPTNQSTLDLLPNQKWLLQVDIEGKNESRQCILETFPDVTGTGSGAVIAPPPAGSIGTTGNLIDIGVLSDTVHDSGIASNTVALKASSSALTSGSVIFADATGKLTQDNNALLWDNTDKTLFVKNTSYETPAGVTPTTFYNNLASYHGYSAVFSGGEGAIGLVGAGEGGHSPTVDLIESNAGGTLVGKATITKINSAIANQGNNLHINIGTNKAYETNTTVATFTPTSRLGIGPGAVIPRESIDTRGAVAFGSRGWLEGAESYAPTTITGNLHYSSGWKFYQDGYGAKIRIGDNTNGAIDFDTASAVNASGADAPATIVTRARITADGFLGLGTTSPATKLHVVGSTVNTSKLLLQNDLGSDTATGEVHSQLKTKKADGTYITNHEYFKPDGTYGLGSYNNADVFQGTKFRLDHINNIMKLVEGAGKVSVGTTDTPTETLHVRDRIRISNSWLEGGTTAYGASLTHNIYYGATNFQFYQNGYGARLRVGDVAGGFLFQTTANNAGGAGANATLIDRMSLDVNGNLGINTTSPSYKLDVNGTARIATVPTITTATSMLVKDPSTGQISEQITAKSGRIACTGATTQTIANTNVTATNAIVITYEDNTGIIPCYVSARVASTSFDVTFAVAPPVTGYINYIIL